MKIIEITVSPTGQTRVETKGFAGAEYACRAGSTTRWSMSDDEDDLRKTANIADASMNSKVPRIKTSPKVWDDGAPFTAPVGIFQANRFGLYGSSQ